MKVALDIFTIIGAIIGLSAFVKGIFEFIHSNTIRRYEKFHAMSVRFDENEDIQAVCVLLHSNDITENSLTKQKKEVFICFLSEIYFMINSGIMEEDLAIYTFGYYAKMAIDKEQFWQDLDKEEHVYIHFKAFCNLAKENLAKLAKENLAKPKIIKY